MHGRVQNYLFDIDSARLLSYTGHQRRKFAYRLRARGTYLQLDTCIPHERFKVCTASLKAHLSLKILHHLLEQHLMPTSLSEMHSFAYSTGTFKHSIWWHDIQERGVK